MSSHLLHLLPCAQGSWAAAGSLWIAMEYCGGGSVADLVHAAEAPLDEGLISYICAQALAGLAYLHSLGKARPHEYGQERLNACGHENR